MKLIKTAVFYNPNMGYIITSYTTRSDCGVRVVLNPTITSDKDISALELGKLIQEGLSKTKNAQPVSREEIENYKFWQVSGIQGFPSFSKKYRMIDITKTEDYYEVIERKRDSKGAYNHSKGDLVNKLSLISKPEDIGKYVISLFQEKKEIKNPDVVTMKTVHDNVVNYTRPSDDFIDIGDGHTDAYQIYTHEDNDENNIMFVIDNLYDDTTEKTIKSQWERWYGELKDFQYHKVDDDVIKIKIRGKTDKEEINSYFYQDGDALMEVTTKVDFINTSVEQQKKIKEEFDKVIKSIKIVTK